MPKGVSIDPSIFDEILTDTRRELREPRMYRVIMYNDDYTTRDFVVEVLVSVFGKEPIEAARIMMDVHKKGSGVVGVYTYDVAATRVSRVHQMAREAGFPFRCGIEEA